MFRGTLLIGGESLQLRAIVLGASGPREALLYWRPLGATNLARVPLDRVARGVYQAELAEDEIVDDFEYYIEMKTDAGPLRFPATAPTLNQTVVVVGRDRGR